MELVRFFSLVVRIGILLALAGELKTCTLVMLDKAASKHELMSYSKFTKVLTGR